MELTQPKDLQDCLEKAGSSSQKAIEDCLHVSDVQFTQIEKMAKCLDGDFKTFKELFFLQIDRSKANQLFLTSVSWRLTGEEKRISPRRARKDVRL